ncbi:hypothetical protein D3C85_1687970 [compost metagenome]
MQVNVVRLDVRTTAVVATTLVELFELLTDIAWDVQASLLYPATNHWPRDDLVQVFDDRLDLGTDKEGRPNLFGRQVLVDFEVQFPKLVLRLGA